MFWKPEKYTLKYFQPGQLAFFVSHPGLDGLAERDIKDLIRKFLEENSVILRDAAKNKFARLSLASIHSFPKIEAKRGVELDYKRNSRQGPKRGPRINSRDESSLFFANIKGVDKDPFKFLEFTKKFESKLPMGQRVNGLTLESISLNWLTSGSPKPGGTGGPGGWPLAYRGNPSFAPYRFDLPVIKEDSKKGRGVDVIILDTAPSNWDIKIAYNRYKDWHPLIHSMLRPDGPLKVHHAPLDERYRIAGLRTLGHNYKMTDHGLFVAGIIHSIAPCAKIHLVEVLNPYGVGDFKSIIRGLEFALDREFQGRDDAKLPFVVNCSLTLNLPRTEDHFRTIASKDGDCFIDLFTDFDRELEKGILDFGLDRIKHQADAFEAVCDEIFALNSRVIAAAGNDRRPGQETVPEARYPAAFESVHGVGALPKHSTFTNEGQLKTASYSNKADIPVNIGIATFGGEVGEGEGMLGLYLGKFPGGEANRTKWAWWSGTSFAAPVLSGISAALLSDRLNHPRAWPEILDELYNGLSSMQNDQGESGEDVLLLTQGISS
jgi:subtilisin family serine protease